MLGPCAHHIYDLPQLARRVADLGEPFDVLPRTWAALVCLTETVGTLLIVTGKLPRVGAAVLVPKMAVATYGHAFIDGFDAKFDESYASAYTPPGLSYNWSVGSSWDCGFFGAGYFLIAYLALLALATPSAIAPAAATKKAV